MGWPFDNPKLVLDEPRDIYYAGQMLRGCIEGELKDSLSFAGMTITFLGEAITKWSEIEGSEYHGRRSEDEITYRGREEYFNIKQPFNIAGNQLPPGQHKLPFEFLIPQNIPSTYNNKRGYVKYTIKVEIEYENVLYPPKFSYDSLEKEFEVVSPLDLNNEEGRKPTGMEFEEFYSSCCNSATLNLKISLPQTGYCPGQAIPITIHAKNETSTEIKKIKFLLVQRKAFRTPESEYEEPDEILGTIKTGPILSNTNRELKYQIVVPPMIAPNMDNCDIIDMGFALKAIIKMSGCNSDLEDETEVILGVVPIPGTLGSETYVHPMKDSLPNAPVPIPTQNNIASVNNYQQSASPYPPQPRQINSYPNPATSYPNSNPYPISPQNFNNPYPNHNQPLKYPSTASSNPGYPPNSESIPLTSKPASTIGFVVPRDQTPTSFPYPVGSPYPVGNQESSPFTPLMQNYPSNSPSAPPPSS